MLLSTGRIARRLAAGGRCITTGEVHISVFLVLWVLMLLLLLLRVSMRH
jgi:hypothetical protein